jgi:hypothetical protein
VRSGGTTWQQKVIWSGAIALPSPSCSIISARHDRTSCCTSCTHAAMSKPAASWSPLAAKISTSPW